MSSWLRLAVVTWLGGCSTQVPSEVSRPMSAFDRAFIESSRAFNAARLECDRFGKRLDGGFCPRICTNAHLDGVGCSPGQVCVDRNDPRRIGVWWGCYDACDAGECPNDIECRVVTIPVTPDDGGDGERTTFALCVPSEGVVPMWP